MTRFPDSLDELMKILTGSPHFYAGAPSPSYMAGHCHFPTDRNNTPCRAAATTHILLDGANGVGSFVCAQHAPIALRTLNPIDWHDVKHPCIGRRRRWQGSSPPGNGYCIEDEPEADAHQERDAGELIGAGQQ